MWSEEEKGVEAVCRGGRGLAYRRKGFVFTQGADLPFSESCNVDNKTIHPMRSEEFEVGNHEITTVLHEGHSGTRVKKA